MAVLVVVTEKNDATGLNEHFVVTADEYLKGNCAHAGDTVINLCRDISYASKGYYVSLLADAREHVVIPTIKTMSGLAEPYTRFRVLQEAGVSTIDAGEQAMRRRLHGGTIATAENTAETLAILGVSSDARFQKAARAAFTEWPAPLLRLQLAHENNEWKITQVEAASPDELTSEEKQKLVAALSDERAVTQSVKPKSETTRASIAVLFEPDNPFSPSSPETIDRLERVASRMNVHIARIGLKDLRRLPEYDALFVRAHTSVTQTGFQFALRAEALGMPVVDATQSTIRCTNKVYIEELLARANVPTPRACIVTANTAWADVATLGLPFVLKRPDGDFSAAVHKINNLEEYDRYAREMFAASPLLIAQEWLPTDFDWRIGVLGGKLLFAAKYYMAKGHWQIRSVEKGTERYGQVQAIPRAQAPRDVVDIAIRAAALIGDGFYGVDIKEGPNGPVVIEVNDNANLDTGYEDTADGDLIYEDLIKYFVDKVEARGDRAVATQSTSRSSSYRLFEVAGIELEYPIVDRALNVKAVVEPAFRLLAGRGTSDVDLGAIGFSNEFADHVLELKTQSPMASTSEIEELLQSGIERFNALLRDEFDARLLPTAMHPWFDPMQGRLWTRSGLKVYTTYARLFDVRTHGWMNVQASHLNLPFGDERETVAMMNAAALLIPYLPAIAASSPMYDGKLQDAADSRMHFLSHHQARIPESIGAIVPEYTSGYADYRKHILQPMYDALDRLPHSEAIRHEFFNTRAAIFRFSRRALEIRALDTQECVKMDVAIACFVRWSLKHLTEQLLDNNLSLPNHDMLVNDFQETVVHGSNAHVHRGPVKPVLRSFLEGARRVAPAADMKYLDLVERVIESGTLSERIRARLEHYKESGEFREAARSVYSELADCLEANKPWEGRWT